LANLIHLKQGRQIADFNFSPSPTSHLKGTRRLMIIIHFLMLKLFFLLFDSTFFLTKKWSKKSRTAQLLRMPVQPTAQQSLRVRTLDSLRCSVFHLRRGLHCLVRTVFSLKGFVMRYLRRCLSGSYSLEILQVSGAGKKALQSVLSPECEGFVGGKALETFFIEPV
jgi:hypothetical protein